MKKLQWILIAGRVLTIAFSLTLLGSGCGDQNAATGNVTEEEKKRDEDTRKAMEAASKSSTDAAKKH